MGSKWSWQRLEESCEILTKSGRISVCLDLLAGSGTRSNEFGRNPEKSWQILKTLREFLRSVWTLNVSLPRKTAMHLTVSLIDTPYMENTCAAVPVGFRSAQFWTELGLPLLSIICYHSYAMKGNESNLNAFGNENIFLIMMLLGMRLH